MTALIGVCSLAVDFGRVELDKTALESAADAASRAACSSLTGGVTAAQNAAVRTAAQNSVENSPVVINPATDISFGTWNPTTQIFTVLTGSAQANANAIRIVAGMTKARGNAVPLTFAALVGKSSYDVQVQSTACLVGNTGNCSLIGVAGITMSGSAFTDSYNSSNGPYSAASANHKGSIASNGAISISNTAKVDGDVRCGVGQNTTVQAPATATGLVAPLGAQLTYPHVTLPGSYYDLGDVNMSGGSVSVPGGTYLIHNLTLSGTANINWTGPVTLYIQDSYNITGNATISTYQNLPANRVLNFLSSCSTATWAGSHVCIGELYAPDTDFTIGGTAQLFGRVTAHTISINTNGGMHYDEALTPPGGSAPNLPVMLVQ